MSLAPRRKRTGPPPVDGRKEHLGWLSMVEISGPFLTVPVLRAVWPTLDTLEKDARDGLRAAHAAWRTDPSDAAGQLAWITYVLGDLLEWGDALETDPEELSRVGSPDFALVAPGEIAKPDTTSMLGMICEPGIVPTSLRRDEDDDGAVAPTDRLAQLCRTQGVELGLATDGRWWTLVWAPIGGVTATATFDAVSWPEQADRDVVRAFRSLLRRSRFFAAPDKQMLVPLLRLSLDNQEEVTEALGMQVRQAVELLVEAIGRSTVRRPGTLAAVEAQDVYRGAVGVMMRVVFLLFAEERGLLPADNDLYAQAYSAGRLHDELRTAADQGSEEDLEHSIAAWLRLQALFAAVYSGVHHGRLTLPAYDGSIFDPKPYPWMADVRVDDRTVLHMLKSVQRVVIKGEERALSFRALDVEQIGYVYEGLLSFEARHAQEPVVGLIGKAGLEEEITVRELQAHASAAPERTALAARLAEAFKNSRMGTPAVLAKRLTPLSEGEQAEAERKLLAVTDNATTQRLLPFFRLLRTDLRGLPVVINTDALYVTESRLRRNTGTHYTPRKLAEQVVESALEPLVHSPGPLQTADRSAWVLKSSKEILSLNVADIAMGSGAFLVAACRYLADKLVTAWSREGRAEGRLIQDEGYGEHAVHDAEADPLVIDARRAIIEHCLYGVDINPMAVEMAKLSLWLVSMDPHRPFTFLDDRLVAGDSLLGTTSLDQIEYMHLDPAVGRSLHEGTLLDFTAGIRSVVAEVTAARRQLREMPGGTLAELAAKRDVLVTASERTAHARLAADLVTGAALAGSRKSAGSRDPNARGEATDDRRSRREGLAMEAARLASDAVNSDRVDAARDKAAAWLETDRPAGGFERQPVHWALAFPEVMGAGGFDAIIGNPPFLGGTKISGPMGVAYRSYIASYLIGADTDRADYVTFFFARCESLLSKGGVVGFVATQAAAQGSSKDFGLARLIAKKWILFRAESKKPWSSKAAGVFVIRVWLSRSPWYWKVFLDGREVGAISPSLTAVTDKLVEPLRLLENAGLGLQGSKPSAKGFIVPAKVRHDMIGADPRNAEVVRPYLTGDDLNNDPNFAPRRYIINFRNWTRERAELYREPFEWVANRVPEERRGSSEEGNPNWWQFGRPATALYERIKGLPSVIAYAETSKTLMPALIPSSSTFSNTVVVLPFSDTGTLALLSSAVHYWWALEHGTSMKGDPRYQLPRCFENFPRCSIDTKLSNLGQDLLVSRNVVMATRQVGLTLIYNMVHDKTNSDADVVSLRRVHAALDEETVQSYGWTDLDLDHGFQDTRQGIRYTVSEVARQAILNRLLQLNHERYADEQSRGLHTAKKVSKSRKPDEGSDKLPSLF